MDTDLDAKALEVLESIYELGGEASTSGVKEYTGIEKNAIIHYRFDKLEEQGVVEMGTGEAPGNRLPPKVATLTEAGGERIADGLFSDEKPTVVERVDRLERQLENVVKELQEVEITELLERVERVDSSLAGIDPSMLEDALAVEKRMERIEERFRIKGKWANSFDHVSRESVLDGSTWRQYDVDGYDVMMAAYSGLDVGPPAEPPEDRPAMDFETEDNGNSE
jgi:DNA-binding PadR family transcriptional regulator